MFNYGAPLKNGQPIRQEQKHNYVPQGGLWQSPCRVCGAPPNFYRHN